MKPILEWYQDLPEPIRSQAIENYDPDFAKLVNEMASSQSEAIWYGFSWLKTKQCGYYWAKICDRAESGEFDDQIELKS